MGLFISDCGGFGLDKLYNKSYNNNKVVTKLTLKERRNAKKMTQIEIAKAVGVTEQTYRQWERGAMKPNEKNAKKLEEVLKGES